MYEQCPNGCDDFMLFSRDLDTENNAIINSCAVCDWIEVEHNPFYVSAWVVSVNQALAPIDIVQSLLTNKDVVGFLRPRLAGVSFLANRDSSAWEFTVGSDEYLRGEVDIAYQTYLRQMIVLAATYIELILKDFFDSFFTASPQYLIDLLGKNDAFVKKAMNAVTFDNIMKGDARDAMVNHAFNSMQRGDRWRILEYLADHTPIRLDLKLLFNGLKSLITQRDDIAHNSLYDPFDNSGLDVQQVYEDFKLVINLLCVLEEIAKKNDIPYWKEFECNFNEIIV